MKAVIAKQPGGIDVLELVDIDEPSPNEDEVKIRVRAFGLNKAESYYRNGNYGTFIPNQALGIEAVGEVVEDPSNHFRVGQKVATVMGGLMFSRHGGYAEYIVVNRNNSVAINSTLNFTELAALPQVYLTVWGALDGNLQIAKGETLLVRGATSALGMAALTYAKARGLQVIATTRNEQSREKLKELGADHVIIDTDDIHSQIKDIVPSGIDKALEIVGAIAKTAKNRGGNVVINALVESQRERNDENSGEKFAAKLGYLKTLGIENPNIDMFLATISGDVSALDAALKAGADPAARCAAYMGNLTTEELVEKQNAESATAILNILLS